MNARQRRGLFLLLVATLGAAVIFVGVLQYVAGVSDQVGDKVTAYEVTRRVVAYTPLTADDVRPVRMPERWLPRAAVRSFDPTRGLVASTDLDEGALLQNTMLTNPPELLPGQRELAILIDAETGVAGKVQRGALVDIYATFGAEEGTVNQARIIVTNALVLDIGQLESVENSKDNGTFSREQVVPVTFALDVADSLALSYAESFATTVRLALVAPGSRSNIAPTSRVLTGAQLIPVPR